MTDSIGKDDSRPYPKDELGICLLMIDGNGIFINNDNYHNFKWATIKDTIIFECADTIPLVGKYSYSNHRNSSVTLEKEDKKEVLSKRNNINIELVDDDTIKTIKYHNDKIFAFNNRIIKTQPPKIMIGIYNKNTNILYLSKKDYKRNSIGMAQRYDQLEIFVIDNNKGNRNFITSFIIIYNPCDNSVSGIYYVRKFNIERDYDKGRSNEKNKNIWNNFLY